MSIFPNTSSAAPHRYRTAGESTRDTGSPGNGNDTFEQREHAEFDSQTSRPSEGSPTASVASSSELSTPGTVIALGPTMPSTAIPLLIDRAIQLHLAGDLDTAAVAYTKLLGVRALGSYNRYVLTSIGYRTIIGFDTISVNEKTNRNRYDFDI